MKILLLTIVFFFQVGCASELYYYKNNEKVFLDTANYNSRSNIKINENVDYYQTDTGTILGVSDTLLVKTKAEVDISSYLNEFDLILDSKLGIDLYVLKTKDKSLTIDISNRLYLKDNIKYAHPNFLKQRIKR